MADGALSVAGARRPLPPAAAPPLGPAASRSDAEVARSGAPLGPRAGSPVTPTESGRRACTYESTCSRSWWWEAGSPRLCGGRRRAAGVMASVRAAQAALWGAEERPAPPDGPARRMGRCPQAGWRAPSTSWVADPVEPAEELHAAQHEDRHDRHPQRHHRLRVDELGSLGRHGHRDHVQLGDAARRQAVGPVRVSHLEGDRVVGQVRLAEGCALKKKRRG